MLVSCFIVPIPIDSMFTSGYNAAMKKRLHIFSFDGLSTLDMPFLETQPNFKRLLDGAAYSYKVKSIYPSLTYPAHCSIVTGNYPVKHGVVNNTFLQPSAEKPDWFWYAKYIKTKTFQELARENGYSISSLMWPVTAKAAIRYNMPEIFPSSNTIKNQIRLSLSAGSKLFQLNLLARYGSELSGMHEPELDNFLMKCWLYAYRRYPTDITMTHFIDLDSIRHDYGFYSDEAKAALQRHDRRLGLILDRIEQSGDAQNTTIIALGDHSSLDANCIIFLNTLFKNKKLLTSEKNNIPDYQVIAKSTGGSTYIYAQEHLDSTEQQKLFDTVASLIKTEIPAEAIEALYTGAEAGKLGADNNCLMMLEAHKGYLFEDDIAEKPLMSIEELDNCKETHYHKNNHGYSPFTKPNYETVFIAKGSGIKKNFDIGEMCLVDEGPTFAKILGLELKNCDGKILNIFESR